MTKNMKFDLAELIDKLSVTQIKQLKNTNECEKLEEGVQAIMNELDESYFHSSEIILSGELVNILIAIAQINTFIWLYRDKINESNEELDKNIKLSHQLNAIRNLAKNKLNFIFGKNSEAEKKLNVNKEDLKGWRYKIVE